jgi:hypothetical protein
MTWDLDAVAEIADMTAAAMAAVAEIWEDAPEATAKSLGIDLSSQYRLGQMFDGTSAPQSFVWYLVYFIARSRHNVCIS